MKKKKILSSLPYFISIAFFACSIFFSFPKFFKVLITNWWNTSQSETLFSYIQEKLFLQKFIEFYKLFCFEEILKKYSETYIQKLGIHKETIQLIKTYNQYNHYIPFHFSTNIIFSSILCRYFLFFTKEFIILNCWDHKFRYNLSDTIKAFSILLVSDLGIGFHSTHGWKLLIYLVYNDFALTHKDQIISGLISTFPVILDTIVKYWIFQYLNRVSPSLVVIYHSINE